MIFEEMAQHCALHPIWLFTALQTVFAALAPLTFIMWTMSSELHVTRE